MAVVQTWGQRWASDSFYDHHPPGAHFSTAPMHHDRIAARIAARIRQVASPDRVLEVIEVGAGDGALITAVAQDLRATGITLDAHALDLQPKPPDLDPGITWHHRDVRTAPLPRTPGSQPFLIAHEFLDDLPCEVLELDPEPHIMVANDDGTLVRGPALSDSDACTALHLDVPEILDWVHRWWPLGPQRQRIEVGIEREHTWRRLVHQIRGGMAFAIDYGHLLAERRVGTWDGGTLAGYRHHQLVAPRLDGQTNVTAHVAFDALAHATGAPCTIRRHSATDFLTLVVDMTGSPDA
jgi:SAM-dependent MidA family methyltransferase